MRETIHFSFFTYFPGDQRERARSAHRRCGIMSTEHHKRGHYSPIDHPAGRRYDALRVLLTAGAGAVGGLWITAIKSTEKISLDFFKKSLTIRLDCDRILES